MKKIQIVKDKKELVACASDFIVKKIRETLLSQPQCTIALAGGSTPKPIYEQMAETDLPWEKIHLFWGDERYVPPTHPDSNEKMVREAWLNRIHIPPENIHPMPTNSDNPQEDADKYNQELLDFFGLSQGFPAFDIILLGMGDDGHTASLFPYTQALQECDRLITVGNKGESQRLTFTLPLINAAKCVIFLVSGKNKQQALKAVFEENSDSNQYPSKKIQPQGQLIWFIDQDANSLNK